MDEAAVERAMELLGASPPKEVGSWFAARDALEAHRGRLPISMRWWFGHYGGAEFSEPVFYMDPSVNESVMLGWLLDAKEALMSFRAYEDVVAPGMVPIANDGGDNLLWVDTSDESLAVHFFAHDHGVDDDGHLRGYRVAESFEGFLLALHREAIADA